MAAGKLDSLVISRVSPAGRCRDTYQANRVEHHPDRSLTTGGGVVQPEVPRRSSGVERGRTCARVRTRGFYKRDTLS